MARSLVEHQMHIKLTMWEAYTYYRISFPHRVLVTPSNRCHYKPCFWCPGSNEYKNEEPVTDLPWWYSGFGVALLSPRAWDQIPATVAHFNGSKMQKLSCTMHWVHVNEPQVVKSNPECATAACLRIILWFWHVKSYIFKEPVTYRLPLSKL